MIKKSYRRAMLAFLTFLCVNAYAQSDEAAVKEAVNLLFDGMKKGDTALIRKAFAPDAILQTVIKNKEGKVSVVTEPVDSFLVAISRPHKEVYDERITFDVVRIDGELALAWTPYQFYVGDAFHHCGVDSFQLVKLATGWKILYLVDTRRRQGCQ